MVITTRKFIASTDTGIILDTMPKSLYYDTHPRKGRPSQKWFTEFHAYLTALLTHAQIYVAVLEDDPDMILGYGIFHGDTLEFLYTKEGYRRQGVATLLARQYEYKKLNPKHITKLAKQILDNKFQKEQESMDDSKKTPSEAAHGHSSEATRTSPLTDEQKIQHFIEQGFAIRYVAFQSAVLSGFNAAENQFSMDSSNKMRVPTSLHWTPAGIIIKQNGKVIPVSLSNVISGSMQKIG